MFNKVTITYNEKKDVYDFSGYFGTRFKGIMEVRLVGRKKAKYFFININMLGFSVYGFFVIDVYYLFKYILENESSIYGLNMKSIQQTMIAIEEQIFSKTIACKHNLNYNRMKSELKYEPLKHQLVAFEAYENTRCKLGYRGLLLDAAVGSGKSFMSCALSEALDSEKIIVIAPLPTIEKVWVKTIAGDKSDSEMVYNYKQSYYNPVNKNEYQGEKFIIVHYENIKKLELIIKELPNQNVTLIVDEVHNFNDNKSKRTKELLSITDSISPDNVILLSGTPIKAIASEMSTMFRLIDTSFTSVVAKRFEKVYKSPNNIFKEILPVKYSLYSVKIRKQDLDIKPIITKYLKVKIKNEKDYYLDTIREKMKEYIVNRHKELSEKMDYYKETYYRLYNKAKKELLNQNNGIYLKDFKKYEEDFNTIIKNYKKNNLMSIPTVIVRVNDFERKWIEPILSGQDKKDFRESKTIVKYLYLKLQGEALANIVMRARINCYRDMARTAVDYKGILESTIKKTIIFSNYIDVCKAAEETLAKKGFKPIGVYGETTKYLSSHVGLFKNDKSYNPLIATYKSLSTGVPLIMANVILILGLPPRTYIYEQAIGRAWRTGQDKSVYVYITELDTGDEYNITNRDIDIIKYFKKQVEEITGYSSSVDLNGEELEHLNISTEDYYGTNITDMIVTNHKTKTIFNDWIN